MATISTFLRAIRAGAVHAKHGAVLLAHFGRLGPVFDLCTKVVIDVLREEGMYNENGDIVVDVVIQALKEVCLSATVVTVDLLTQSSHLAIYWTRLCIAKTILSTWRNS